MNHNGSQLVSCGGDRLIKIYDVTNLKNGATITSNSAETIYISAKMNQMGDRILAGSTDRKVTMFKT